MIYILSMFDMYEEMIWEQKITIIGKQLDWMESYSISSIYYFITKTNLF